MAGINGMISSIRCEHDLTKDAEEKYAADGVVGNTG